MKPMFLKLHNMLVCNLSIGTQRFSNAAVAIILSLILAVLIFGAIVARYKYQQGVMNKSLNMHIIILN